MDAPIDGGAEKAQHCIRVVISVRKGRVHFRSIDMGLTRQKGLQNNCFPMISFSASAFDYLSDQIESVSSK